MKKLITLFAGVVVAVPFLASANMMGYGDGYGRGYGMMGGYGGGWLSAFFMVVNGIVWTAIGILVMVWLWKQINKK